MRPSDEPAPIAVESWRDSLHLQTRMPVRVLAADRMVQMRWQDRVPLATLFVYALPVRRPAVVESYLRSSCIYVLVEPPEVMVIDLGNW